jgi:signal transduction histidine kinase/CheY-like chemotaxis protein
MDRSTHPRERLLARFVRELLDDAVVVLDASGELVEANRAAAAGACDVLALFGSAARGDERVADLLGELREQGAATTEITVPARDGGNSRHLRLQGVALGDGFVVVVRDHSEARRLADEVRQLRGLASLGLLTASVAHDLNNLLTPIYALGSFLAGKVEREEPRLLAGEILTAAERAVRLVRTVLTASRPKSPELEIVDVNAAVAEMKPLIARLLGPSTELALFFDRVPTPSVFERARFEHALLNLAANARDAMPGRGRLTITTANVTLGNGAGDPSGERSYVMISVTDTGVGMSEQTCAHIFDPFFTTKGGEHGVGLGLASVRNFATDLGGFVSAHSAPGEGTTISVYLPSAAQDAPRRAALTDRQAAAAGRGETVLVVDADAAVRRAAALVLQAHGYGVLAADSEPSALRVASSAEPPVDLVLLDVDLPTGDPRALRERLLAAADGAGLLLMSAAGASAPPPRAQQPGGPAAPALLRKAFSSEELLAAVRAVLDVRRGE